MAAPKVSGIYEIVNLINGKRYIGSSVDLRRRLLVHRRDLAACCHHNAKLQNAWRKHGPDAFSFSVILECERTALIAEEQAAMDRLAPEYNLSPTAGNILGFRFSEDQKAKLRGRKQSAATVEKRAAAHRGSKRTDETRARISQARAGKPVAPRSPEHCAALSAAQKGKAKSKEQMEALQAGRRARAITDEENAKRSESLKRAYAEGRIKRERSPEYREKIAATLRERAKDPEVREKMRQQALAAAARRRAAD